jgi:hypothetical protein
LDVSANQTNEHCDILLAVAMNKDNMNAGRNINVDNQKFLQLNIE